MSAGFTFSRLFQTKQLPKHESFEFAKFAQETSRKLVNYVKTRTTLINTDQITFNVVSYPSRVRVHSTGKPTDGHDTWEASGVLEFVEKKIRNNVLLDVLADKDSVTLYEPIVAGLTIIFSYHPGLQSRLINLISELAPGYTGTFKRNKRNISLNGLKIGTGTTKGTRIWQLGGRTVYRGHNEFVVHYGYTPTPGQYHYLPIIKETIDLTKPLVKLCVNNKKEQTKQQIVIALDILKLLKDFCNLRLKDETISKDDKNEYLFNIASIKVTLNQNGRDATLLKLVQEFSGFIEEQNEKVDTKVDTSKATASAINSTDIPLLPKRLEELFLNKILPLISQNIRDGYDFQKQPEILKFLLESSLLDLSDLSFRTEIMNLLGQASYSKCHLTDGINNKQNHNEKPMPDLEHLKQARELFFQEINNLIIKNVEGISSQNDDHINKLCEILKEYEYLIHELELENNSEKSKARKKDDGCGAGAGAGAGAGGSSSSSAESKGKGPAYMMGEVSEEMSPLELAKSHGFNPKNPSDFVDGVKNSGKLTSASVLSLIKNNQNTEAGVLFGIYLQLLSMEAENKRLKEETFKMVSYGGGRSFSSTVPMAASVTAQEQLLAKEECAIITYDSD